MSSVLGPIKTFVVNKFSSQNVPVNDILAIIGITAIVIFTATAYYLILQLRNYLNKRKSQGIVENNLNSLIHDIEDFIKKWRVTRFLRLSYKREIQGKSMWGNRFMIRKHTITIRNSAKNLKVLVDENNNLFTSLDETIDRMVDFGLELELVFETVGNIKQTTESKFNELVSEGVNICDKLRNTILELEKLRGSLS